MRLAISLLLLVGCNDGVVRFGLPVAQPELIEHTIGVDHDPAVYEGGTLGAGVCRNYEGRGFPWCYDEHRGSDFLLAGEFETMDNGSAAVVAAADGVVVAVHDGEYDRCHIEGTQVTCDGRELRANYVIIDHGGGVETWYWHLKRGSVSTYVGEEVECGAALGLIGSSGISALPHLHFQVEVDGESVDPYAGDYSQPESWWQEQRLVLPARGCTR